MKAWPVTMTQAKPRETKTFASDAASLETRKERARVWFEALRDDMLAALEAVEDASRGLLGLCRESRPGASPARPGRGPSLTERLEAAGSWR